MNLESIKLLDHEPDATDIEVDEFIEHLVQGGGGGWGLRQIDRIFLTMARAARVGLGATRDLDEATRALQGARLEIGRKKSKIEQLQASNTELAGVLNQATTSTAAKDATIASQQHEIRRLQEQLSDGNEVLDRTPSIG
jgi:septal ring factor EnvC (AmiA/AmiB activator)